MLASSDFLQLFDYMQFCLLGQEKLNFVFFYTPTLYTINMKQKTRRFCFILSCSAVIMCAFLEIWLFSLQCTRGAFNWGFQLPFVGIGILSILPLAIFGLALLLKEGVLQKLVIIKSYILSVLSISLTIGLALYIIVVSTQPIIGNDISRLLLSENLSRWNTEEPLITEKGKPIRFAVSSDPHFIKEKAAHEETDKIIDLVNKNKYNGFFILGDYVELGMYASPWLIPLEKLSRLQVPFCPLLGNHDALINGDVHFQELFPSPHWFTVETPGITFVVINLLYGPEDFGAKQQAWLEKTLSGIPEDQSIVVLSHCFIYSSGYTESDGENWFDHKENIEKVSPILEKYKVDLVVSGHNHYMEMLESNGVQYAVIGAMGGVPDPEPTYKSPSSQWFSRGVFGLLEIQSNTTGLSIRFLDSDGKSLFEKTITRARGAAL